MTTMGWMRTWVVAMTMGLLGAGAAASAPLTADDAVKIALKNNSQVLNAEAGILQAKAGLYGAYGNLLPNVSVAVSRGDQRVDRAFGQASVIFLDDGTPFLPEGSRSNSSATTLSGSWNLLDLSSWAERSAAVQGLRASRLTREATRSDVALGTRRQFYEVVKAIKLAEVAKGALQRAQDDERRVRAMFEVGSVSKSDLLKAQVTAAQSELDAISAQDAITIQRIVLANQIGVKESDLGDVDTLLAIQPNTYDETAIFSEAARNRPDLIAAEASVRSARASHTAARMGRLPYVSASGSGTFNSRSFSSLTGRDLRTGADRSLPVSVSGVDRSWRAQIAINWNVFNLGAVEARIASSRASLDRAVEARDALRRGLGSEVRQALLAHHEAVTQHGVSQRGLESATESLKLTQEKYNVGSATILELIDAQVQLQTAQSNVVRALAAIRVAEAQINRVRGQSQ